MKPFTIFVQVCLTLVLVSLAIALLNPWHFWMPTSFHMMLIGLLLAFFGVFILLIWRQKAVDEREELHQMIESRAAYVAGAAILTAALVAQSLQHQVDPWVVHALCAMFIVKTIASIWTQMRR